MRKTTVSILLAAAVLAGTACTSNDKTKTAASASTTTTEAPTTTTSTEPPTTTTTVPPTTTTTRVLLPHEKNAALMTYCVNAAKALYKRRPDIAKGKDPVARCAKQIDDGSFVDRADVDAEIKYTEAFYPAPTTTPAPAPTTTTTAPTPTPTTTPPAKTWVAVASFAGVGDKSGPPFELQGGQQRITYTCAGRNVYGYVYVEPTGSTRYEDWNASCPSGNSMAYLAAGTYYIKGITTPDTTWTVKVEELR